MSQVSFTFFCSNTFSKSFFESMILPLPNSSGGAITKVFSSFKSIRDVISFTSNSSYFVCLSVAHFDSKK